LLSSKRAFTLIELMIAVAIVGVLASIAIPNFHKQSLRAKQSESRLVLDGIATAEYAYAAAFDSYASAASNPGASLTKALRDWKRSEPDWEALDFEPAGQVRCNYSVAIYGSTPEYFRADAYCDLDDDNVSGILRYYSVESGRGYDFYEVRPGVF